MTVDMILKHIEEKIAYFEMTLDWLNENGTDELSFRWYAAQQYALEELRDRIKYGLL